MNKRSLPSDKTFCHEDYYNEFNKRSKTMPDLNLENRKMVNICERPGTDKSDYIGFIRILDSVQDTLLTTTEVIYIKSDYMDTRKALPDLEQKKNVDISRSKDGKFYILKVTLCPFQTFR